MSDDTATVELVGQLRNHPFIDGDNVHEVFVLMREAADLIEQQARTIAELREQTLAAKGVYDALVQSREYWDKKREATIAEQAARLEVLSLAESALLSDDKAVRLNAWTAVCAAIDGPKT